MKLVSMNCPHCNGPLKVNPELAQASCNYCGFQFMIDDEIKKVKISEEDYEPIGKAMNDARLESDRKTAAEALEKVGKIRDSYKKTNELQGRGQFLRSRLYDDERRIASIESWMKFWNFLPNSLSLFIFPVGIFVLFLIIGIASWFAAGGIIAAGLVIAFLSYFGFRWMRNKQSFDYGNLVAEANSIKADIAKTDKELQEVKNDADFSFVPQKYHNPAALNFIYQVLYDKRANNLSQAINLYEENIYRSNMQRMQDEQIRLQKQQLEEMRQQQEERDTSRKKDKDKGIDAASVISTAGKVAATGLFLKAGHDILKGIKDQFF